ncbi:transposase [Liquorilactobacillus aquaticus]|uniref:transposase n=1 Tax=Liquorilactobacillus aquaticus TaxID=392566 RepID=UPI00070A8C11|nr:transposase [Liquorilactobacillus aquaticus]
MPKIYSKEFRESIFGLVKQGHTLKSLAEEYNVLANTINRWIKQNKVINVNEHSLSNE